MRKYKCLVLIALFALVAVGCGQSAKSGKTTQQILSEINGKSMDAIVQMYGTPDADETNSHGQRKITYWNFAERGGDNVPPEKRGKVVHFSLQEALGGRLYSFDDVEQ